MTLKYPQNDVFPQDFAVKCQTVMLSVFPVDSSSHLSWINIRLYMTEKNKSLSSKRFVFRFCIFLCTQIVISHASELSL